MKITNNLKRYFFIAILVSVFTVDVYSQGPPPPPPSGHGENGNQEAGGGAPIGGGLFLLLGFGAAYGLNKAYQSGKESLEE